MAETQEIKAVVAQLRQLRYVRWVAYFASDANFALEIAPLNTNVCSVYLAA